MFGIKKDEKNLNLTTSQDQTKGFILLATLFGAMICGFFVFQSDFPLNDGGLFYTMVKDLEANHFALPVFTSYNHAAIPYAYPPLAFYLTAFLNSVLKIDLLQLLRFVPLFFAVLSIPAFYLLTTQLLHNKEQQVLTTFIYAVSPAAYTWQIMGGGLTRAPAWFFSFLALFFFIKYVRQKKFLDLMWFVIFTSFTALTHLEMLWFLALTCLTLYFFIDRTWRGARDLALSAFATLLLISPWWIPLLQDHGLQPFIAAFNTGGFSFSSPLAFLLLMGGMDKISLAMISLLAILGIFLLARQKEWFPAVWLLVLIFLDPRSIQRVAAMPMALLAAVALQACFHWLSTKKPLVEDSRPDEEFVLLQRPVSFIFLAFLVYALFLNLYTFFAGDSYLQTVNQANREAMNWVRDNTAEESRFVVLDFPFGWFSDRVAEWFPALTERSSLLTVQGQEWVTGTASQISAELTQATQCKMNGLQCLEDFFAEEQLDFDYLYFSTDTQKYYVAPQYSSVIEAQISNSDRYELVYSNEDVRIYHLK